MAALVIILFSVLGFRLWYLQILSGDQYIVMADNNRLRTVKIEAPRGVIYDREMRPLVENRAGLSVGVLPMDLRREDEVLPRLAELLEMPLEEVRKKVERGRDNPYVVTVLKEDVDEDTTVAYLEEHRLEFPGVRIEKTYLRSYPKEDFATHVLGYVGEISEDELENEKFRTLDPGARIGKDGVEFAYDSFLRGVDGSRTVEVDAAGRPKREVSVNPPAPGKNLVLTIDGKIQRAAEEAIVEEGFARAHEQDFDNADRGVVIAMDPRNGEILAMASYPDYSPALWVGGMKKSDYERLTSEEADNPFFNRAISGLYPAASTFKPFVALTALDADLITPDTIFYDPGDFWIGRQRWKCWYDEGHGDVNLVQALMESCDTYFYNLGEKFFHQEGPVFQEGLRRFGFGDYTGIDLPDEYYGRVPDKDWKKKEGDTAEEKAWKPGDDVNLSIGQGDLLVTPLQLAVAFSAIANASSPDANNQVALNLLVPRVADQITDASGNPVNELETEKRAEILVDAEDLAAVRRGLEYVTSKPGGTAYAAFKGFPVRVVGKTGTAEKKPEDDYAWFMGYAPAEQPEILVVALIEEGGHGSSVAAPVVRRVMETYFGLEQTVPDEIEVTE
ncbi:MAG: penicillin-binding protein 2 [Thermoleophilia bacterium]